MHLYTNLGAVPQLATREAERSDLLLRWTGDAARKLVASMKRYPVAQRVARLDQALSRYEPGLPAKVRAVATRLRAEGLDTGQAVERALALSLADGTITRIKNMGIAVRQGRTVSSLSGLSGLGTTTPSTSPSPEEILGRTLQGVLCSPVLAASLTDLVGRNEGRDAASATGVGFGVGQGLAQCSSLTATPPPPPPLEPSNDGPSLVLPIVIGVGAIAAVGVALWFTTRKKS